MLKFLPEAVLNEIKEIASDNLCEVRIRAGKKIKIAYRGVGNEIKISSLSQIISVEDLEKCVMRLCNFSVFSAEEHLKRGFITSSEGERVGICGEVVNREDGPFIKNVTSICVRFPKECVGAAEAFFNKYVIDSAKSCLVISPPFHGKTTFIRDLGRLYSDRLKNNVLYLDERNEFSANGKFNLGENSDVFRFCTKEYGFKTGVRSLNPDVIVCDEIMNETDVSAVNFATASGVKVISSIHSDSLKNVLKRQEKSKNFKCFTFDYFIELYKFTIKRIYNSSMETIC